MTVAGGGASRAVPGRRGAFNSDVEKEAPRRKQLGRAAPPRRERDALLGREITWAAGSGVAAGVDDEGRLLVDVAGGERVALDAGEVHLGHLSS